MSGVSRSYVCPLCGKPGFHEPCEIQIGDVREILQRIQNLQTQIQKMFGTKTRREAFDKAFALVNARGSTFEREPTAPKGN